MYLLPASGPLPKHAAVVLYLGREKFVFEDTRYFGRLTLDTTALDRLGPEPLGNELAPDAFSEALKRSSQPIKVKLLDQSLVAGVGNIYANEALFLARIAPGLAANRLGRHRPAGLAGCSRRLSRAIAARLFLWTLLGPGIGTDYSIMGESLERRAREGAVSGL
jgi:formamidopyrimidine-DNA glycosylase